MNIPSARLRAIPNRTFAFAGILAVHFLLIVGFLTGFGDPSAPPGYVPISSPPIEVTRKHETAEPIGDVRPGPIHMEKTVLPLIDVKIDDDAGKGITLPPAHVDDAGGTGEGATVATTPIGYRALHSPNDRYPAGSIRMNEQGIVLVRACVSDKGQLQGAPMIENSSGFPLLDQAALKWIREDVRFTAATRGGAAIAACKGFRVNFQLR